MTAIGAKYKWENGKILRLAKLWQAPTMRRIPRILIEGRALEVGIKMRKEELYMVFEETKELSSQIQTKDAIPLQFYFNRFHLLPEKIDRVDTYDWLKDSKHALLIWGVDNHYFAKPIEK